MLGDECDVSSTDMDGHIVCLKSVPISNIGEVDLPWLNYKFSCKLSWKIEKKIQISAAGGNLVFLYIVSFLTLLPVLGVVSVPAVNHEVAQLHTSLNWALVRSWAFMFALSFLPQL